MTAYRDDLEALTARHATLEAELAAKTREVAESARIVDETRARRQRPMLPNLRVASPCPAAWAQMVGDDRVRACAQCNKNVYNLSSMTRDEAEALLVETECATTSAPTARSSSRTARSACGASGGG